MHQHTAKLGIRATNQMNEVELITEIGIRTQYIWSTGQWWMSICFAMIVAAHVGTEHLTRLITIWVLALFSIGSLQVLLAMANNQNYINAMYQSLEALERTAELGPVAQVALENSRAIGIPPGWFVFPLLYISTIAFVILRHIHNTKSEQRDLNGT